MTSNSPIGGNSPTAKRAESDQQLSSSEQQVSRPATELESQAGRTHWEITCKGEKDWWDKIKPFVEMAGVVLLAVYTGYTIKMYCANKKSADAAKSAADTAAKQESASEVSQRPWIEIANPGIRQKQTIPPVIPFSPVQPLLQNAPYSFIVTVKNYGNTPALRAYVRSNPKWVSLPQVVYVFMQNIPVPTLDSCSRSAPWEHSDGTFFPNATYPLLSNQQIANAEDVSKLMKGRDALFWVGCVRYEDAFKRRYQSNFCFYWSFTEAPLQWNRCLTGNELIEYPPESAE